MDKKFSRARELKSPLCKIAPGKSDRRPLIRKGHYSRRVNTNSVFFFAVVMSSVSGRRTVPYIPESETGQVERTKKT